ncbi:5-formyltetrahydrofolate cyclo-ligase [Bhargavaea ullalensis]|uniref:5-formyltetrahydrofolate cyclo-ligase n=1 Tax=Bhargavaea ullalensis TaxID=1265685 RepID=A0ABV2G902_9BACL
MDKKEIRRAVLGWLRGLSEDDHRIKGRRAADRLISDNRFGEADTIGITVSRHPEIDTLPVIRAAWKAGKRVAVPRCHPADRSMQFREITSFDQLETVYMDLREPAEGRTRPVAKEEIGLIVVPGVVFSPDGFRIGFGGGYYDRYLAGYRGETVSLALEGQLTEGLPAEPHDIPVGSIMTESRTIECGEARDGDRS